MNARADAAPAAAARHRLPVMIAFALLAAWAAWRIASLSIASFLSDDDPAAALGWNAVHAEAIVGAEEARVRQDKQLAPDPARARAALSLAPLKPVAYRLLAREAELRGNASEAARLYEIAALRGPRDLPSVDWVARHKLARGDYAGALASFDQMMRVEPELEDKLKQTLFQIASFGPAQRDFARLLARQPPWRSAFLLRLLGQAPDTAAIFPLVEKLRSEPGAGLSEEELGLWIARLAREGQWGPAYLTWVQSLPPEASRRIGNVYNGGFELEPSQIGFDWQFRSVPGARITRAQVTGADEEVALRIEFDGDRVAFANVRQLLALAPGEYRLHGRVRLDDLRTERGLVWSVRCAEARREIGSTQPLSGRREWQDFEAVFTVPAEQCGGQWLTLMLPSRNKAEQRIGGVAWFDDLSIKSN